MNCFHCNEVVLPEEPQHPINNGRNVVHYECYIRISLGSAEHLRGECTCGKPSGEGIYEPENLSLRENARRAYGTTMVELKWSRVKELNL